MRESGKIASTGHGATALTRPTSRLGELAGTPADDWNRATKAESYWNRASLERPFFSKISRRRRSAST